MNVVGWQERWMLILSLLLYLTLAFGGVRYGLPHGDHLLSYDADETTSLEALGRIRSGKLNPAPELISPTLYLQLYGVTVYTAALLKWIPLHESKEWYRLHPDIFARFYLAGRYLQIFLGTLLLILIWEFGRRLWNPRVAGIATLLMSVSPSFIAASHFSQANIPVTLLCFMALVCFIFDERHHDVTSTWLLTGAFLSGLAISAKYSAFPLLVVLGYQLRFRLQKSSTISLALLYATLGFFIGMPFAFLQPKVFLSAFTEISSNNLMPVEADWWTRLTWPLRFPFAHAMGAGLEVIAVVAFCRELIRSRGKSVLILWTIVFYACVVAAGIAASPGRVLITLPMLAVLSACLFDEVMTRYRFLGMSLTALIVAATLLPSLAIVSLHHREPNQDRASQWIREHIPTNNRIGILRSIQVWTPPIIYSSAHHPERMKNPYQIISFDFSDQKAKQVRPEYIVLSGTERTISETLDRASARAFLSWLDSGKDYEKVMSFPRDLTVGPWRWNRGEYPYYTDDDLWAHSIDIFKRR